MRARWETERLLGNLTLEIEVVTPESVKPKGPDGGGPPQFIDPEGSISLYVMLDVGGGIPTTWCKMTTPTKTDVGNYFGFFDLDALEAPQGYFMALTVIRNSTGNAVAANFIFFNRFQYQFQPLRAREGVSSKKVIVSLNGHEIGRIKFEGSGTFQLWREEVELAAGTNTLTLNPISNTPTSDIAFIDYVLIAPKFWEEEAACELESLYNNLASDGDGL